MAASLAPLLKRLRRVSRAEPDSDAARLDRFARLGDQRAFAALVDVHGPMVLRVCRRVLGDAHAAEDATQATFLVLARKARAIGRPDALAGWLHGVARRVALKARAGLARRGQPLLAADTPADKHPDPLAELSVRELLAIIDEEVERLPLDYRLPVLLCCLEGKSQEEVARQLGWTPGSVKGRLERGRKQLHARLVRRGVVPAAAFAALELCRVAATAAMPAALASATVRAAIAFTGAAAPKTAVSGEVARLATEVLGGAGAGKVKLGMALLLVLGLTAMGATALTRSSPGEPQAGQKPPAEPPAPMVEKKRHVDREGVALPPEAIARVGSTRLRHSGQVKTVAYSPDGKSIASLDEDGHLCFWDPDTGEVQRRFRPSNYADNGRLVFRPDGKSLVIFDGDFCRSVDVATGKELRSFRQHSQFSSFDPAGTFLAIPSGNVLRVVDVDSGKERFRMPVDVAPMIDAAVSPDGKTVAAAVANVGTVILFDAITGKQLRRLEGPDRSAGILAFAPDGKLLVSCGNPPVLWDLAANKVVGQIKGYYNTQCAAFSRDGKHVAAGGADDVIIAEAPSGKVIRRLPVWGATSLAFSADGRTLLVGGWNGDISQWDVETGRLRDASASPFPGISRLRFLDERRLLVRAQTFALWDWQAGNVLRRFAEIDAAPNGSPDVSADGRWLAYPVGKGEIVLIDSQQVGKARRLPGHDSRYVRVRFAPDGRTLFSTGGDKMVRGWDVATGKLRHEWQDHPEVALHLVLVVSPDSRWVVSATTWQQDTVVRLWDVKTNRLAHKLSCPNRYFTTFGFSADSRRLAAGGGEGDFDVNTPGHIVLFDVAAGERVADIAGHPRPVQHVAFSPDGRCLVAVDDKWRKEFLFRYWELATGKERHHFDGHTGRVQALAFSPSGALLAAASPEAPAYVWDVYGKLLPKPPFPANLDEKQRLWQNLGGPDAKVGFQAVRRLIGYPTSSVAFLRERLKPAAPVDLKLVKQRLKELTSDDFELRQSANAELALLGDRIEISLKEAVATSLALEPKRRLQTLIKKLDAPTPERLAPVRALEALEQIATPDAVRLLESLAAGEPGARLTHEATAVLDRLRKR